MPDVTVSLKFASHNRALWQATFNLKLGVGRGINLLPKPYLTSVPVSLSLPDFAHPTFANDPPRLIIAQAFSPMEEVNIEY